MVQFRLLFSSLHWLLLLLLVCLLVCLVGWLLIVSLSVCFGVTLHSHPQIISLFPLPYKVSYGIVSCRSFATNIVLRVGVGKLRVRRLQKKKHEKKFAKIIGSLNDIHHTLFSVPFKSTYMTHGPQQLR